MNRTQNSLSRVGKLTEKGTNSPRTLRIQAAGRFIEEDEQLGAGGELDADGEELALLNVKAFAGDADDGVGKVAHVEHVDDVFDVAVLVLIANRRGLAEHGAEAEAFADGGGFEMEIYRGVSGLGWE